MLLKCLVIGPDGAQAEHLNQALEQLGGTETIKNLAQYPHEYELLRTVRMMTPQVVFLGLQDLEPSFEILRILQSQFGGLQIVAFHDDLSAPILMKLMQIGIREYLPVPFELRAMADILTRVREAAEKSPMVSPQTNLVYTFLPSKPGVGTTTLAINAAIAMARQPETSCLLMDLDLNSGLVRFQLKLDNEHSILDAAEHAAEMDEALWPNLVSSKGQLDILHAGKIRAGVRIEESTIRNLIGYARKSYKAICVDLSGNMEMYGLEAMKESKKIFVVCTPEIPSLHLAREKYHYLKALDLGNRVSFLLNRQSKGDLLQLGEIEELLGTKVAMSFPNDYRGVNQAMSEGKEVHQRTELGRQIHKFSHALLELGTEGQPDPAKKQSKGISEFFKFGSSQLTPVSNSKNKV